MARDEPPGVVTLRGEGTIEQLLRRAVTRIEAFGLDVHAVIDHSGDAADVGVDMPETKLVLFGSPRELVALMVAHPRLAIELPLKLLLAVQDDGHVLVSYQAAGDLAHRFGLTDHEAGALRIVDVIARLTCSSP